MSFPLFCFYFSRFLAKTQPHSCRSQRFNDYDDNATFSARCLPLHHTHIKEINMIQINVLFVVFAAEVADSYAASPRLQS
jgi:hypothetical protein